MRLLPDQLIRMQDRWGDWQYLSADDWQAGKIMLKRFRSTGLSIYGHNEKMNRRDCFTDAYIHRSNLRPEGYNREREEKLSAAILAQLIAVG